MVSTKQVLPGLLMMLTVLINYGTVTQISTACTMPMSNSEVTVNQTSNEGEITVAKGQTLIVKLLTNPGIGYSWQIVKNDADQLKPLGDAILEPLEAEAPGATENQVFRFLAQRSGTSVLELHYLRPWEQDVPPLKTYRLKVQIP